MLRSSCILQGALTRIESATGDSSEESSDDDWGEPQPAGEATKRDDELVTENNSAKTEREVPCLDKTPPLKVQNEEKTVEDSKIETATEVGEIDGINDNEPSSNKIKTDEEITKKGDE